MFGFLRAAPTKVGGDKVDINVCFKIAIFVFQIAIAIINLLI